MKEPSGDFSRNTTVSAVGASTASTARYCGLAARDDARRREDDLVVGGLHVPGRHHAAVVELHALADLERVGALVRRDRPRLGEVADELGARPVGGIHPHERVVVRPDRVEHRERLLPMRVEARRLGGDHEDQLAARPRLVLGLCRDRRPEITRTAARARIASDCPERCPIVSTSVVGEQCWVRYHAAGHGHRPG